MIIVENLTKTFKMPFNNNKRLFDRILAPCYKNKIAVNNISFNIHSGEIVGFVGMNGAGKTTTIKMLSGILTPTSGNINVASYVPYKDRKKYSMEIAVIMGQKSVLFYDIPVIESFKFYKDVYSLSNKQFDERLALFVEKLDLCDLLNIPVRKLSLGQRMKCEIVASILHNPKILFLDEPTIGVDIIAKQKILDFFLYLNKEFNTTIFFTTHDIDDIDRICKRIIIIEQGAIRFDGEIKKIEKRDQYKTIEILHSSDFDINLLPSSISKKILIAENYRTVIQLSKHDVSNMIKLLYYNSHIIDLNINTLSLEQILQNLYKDEQEVVL